MKDVLRLLEEIPNKAQALLGVVVDVNLKSEDGGEYLEIAVDPYPNPISYKGEFYYRSGSTKQVLRGAALSLAASCCRNTVERGMKCPCRASVSGIWTVAYLMGFVSEVLTANDCHRTSWTNPTKG